MSIHNFPRFTAAIIALLACMTGVIAHAQGGQHRMALALLSTLANCTTASDRPQLAVLLNGDNLLVANNDGLGSELCFSFKPCMQNKLMTFSHVGVREVERTTGQPADIFRDSNMKWLNVATSDNIGPVGVKGYSNFVGGNHLWHSSDSTGQKGTGPKTEVMTAKCDSFAIYADGKRLLSNQSTSCRKVTVEVWNTLFDPLIDPAEGATSLSSPLIIEHATYTLEDNSIAVVLEHQYLKSFTVSRYYGMQSMFVGENVILTPNGPYIKWISQGSIKNFSKKKFPWFSHFAERAPGGWCQTTWLMDDDLGAHGCLQDDSPIFSRASNKCYHVLMDNWPVEAGESHRWQGVYVWSRPLIDDDFLTITKGVFHGRTLLIVDAKQAGTCTIDRPTWWTEFYRSVTSHNLDFVVTDNLITITADKATSSILLEIEELDAVDDVQSDVPCHRRDEWYTLQGQRIAPPSQPGIYLHNSSKVLINR